MTQLEKNAEIVKRIRELCKQSGISITTLEKALGYGNGSIGKWAKAPKLEIDATGNEYGQAEPLLTNAISIVQMPKVNIQRLNVRGS